MKPIDTELLMQWLSLHAERLRSEQEKNAINENYDMASWYRTRAITIEEVLEELESGRFNAKDPQVIQVDTEVRI